MFFLNFRADLLIFEEGMLPLIFENKFIQSPIRRERFFLFMNARNMILPAIRTEKELPGITCCSLGKIDWIEAAPDELLAAETIRRALQNVGWRPLPIVERTNLGTRNRISLQRKTDLGPEEYQLTTGHDTITIYGGSGAGVFYGAQSLAQIIACSAQAGGRELLLPACRIEDAPRFPWRGIMLDSARHYQPVNVILELLDHMAEYKFNVFHWHFVDRQGWRPVFQCAPELAGELPVGRSYSSGTYSRADLESVRDYAAARFIRVVPELEMPGHSAAVFHTHPELACPLEDDPYEVDAWEYCLGNPDAKSFLLKILREIMEIFPDAPVIHIGGDEAGTARWHRCGKCQNAMRKQGLKDERELEHAFMTDMAKEVAAMGREPMTWGVKGSMDFPKEMIIQDWLGEESLRAIRAGLRTVASFHAQNYFDYPGGDFDPPADWQRKQYAFEPVPEGTTAEEAERVLGGEGCIWTEQIPFQRVLPRSIPRMRALSEVLWSVREKRNIDDFFARERLLTGSGLYRYS